MDNLFALCQKILQDDTATEQLPPFAQRISNAIEKKKCPKDVAALVRQLLDMSDRRLLVPKQLLESLDHEALEQLGLKVHGLDGDIWVLSALPWRPSWLGEGEEFLEPILREEVRRKDQQVSADPFLALAGKVNYRSIGQRQALRSALLSPPGSTLVINLPTGEGKSLCAHLPAILEAEKKSVVIVVVPTVALAVDQEKAIRESVAHHPNNRAIFNETKLAYHSGLTKNEKNQILGRVRSGDQPILFTSPEALCGPLGIAVCDAAAAGYLKWLAIDEAHTVLDWGEAFRPEFHLLSGFRQDLLRHAQRKERPPFRTLLLSATITEETLLTLERLMGEPGPFVMVAPTQLRGEINWHLKRCASDEEKIKHIEEVLPYLPRPIILYTTFVQEPTDGRQGATAPWWHDRLKQSGYQRLGLMTGKTRTEEREKLLQEWNARKIDIMVATSAFGMGVDMPDVRTVLHATVPENPSRLYQEAGRSGRDGKAAIHLMIYSANDRKAAKKMGTPQTITSELGFERWKAMFAAKTNNPDHTFSVPLNATRAGKPEMKDMGVVRWNMRTLILMASAGLLRFVGLDYVENDDNSQNPFEYRPRVEILADDHLDTALWNDVVENTRQVIRDRAEQDWDDLKRILKARECFGRIFQSVYTIPRDYTRRHESRHRAEPVYRCGGCPTSREKQQNPQDPLIPIPDEFLSRAIQSDIAEQFQGGNLLIARGFHSERPRDLRRAREFVEKCAKQGFRWVTGSGDTLDRFFRGWQPKEVMFLDRDQRPGFWDVEQFPAPTMLLAEKGEGLPGDLFRPNPPDSPPMIIFTADDAKHPLNDQRLLTELYTGPVYTYEYLLQEIFR